MEAVGDPEATAARSRAHDRLRELGVEAAGWDTVFCLAAEPRTRPRGEREHSPL
jgi:hypothetical protein